MKSEESKLLNDWLLQQSEFNNNDLLVSIDSDKTLNFSDHFSYNSIAKVLSFSHNSIKESGINPLCKTVGILKWKWDNQLIKSPIWIIPCDFKIDKVRQLVTIETNDEIGFINPFLSNKLKELFSIQLDSFNYLEVLTILKNAGFESVDSEKEYIDNFHHHRFVLLKELQDLIDLKSYSSPLKQILVGEKENNFVFRLPEEYLLAFDNDQKNVFEIFENESCTVQGPPGTGKSQLLTNLVSKTIFGDLSTVVVSEKRAALEVIQKRLSSSNLDVFSIVVTDDLKTNNFIHSLKTTWEFLSEYEFQNVHQFSSRKEHEMNLQFILDLLNQPKLIGGVTFSKFKELGESINDNSVFQFLTNPPDLDIYESTLSIVEEIYNKKLALPSSIIPFSNACKENLDKYDDKIKDTLSKLSNLEIIQPNLYQHDIDELQKKSVIYQLFQNEIAKKYYSILEPESKKQKRFLKLYKSYRLINKQIELIGNYQSNWKVIPTEEEVISILNSMEKLTYFQKITFKKRWKQLSFLPVSNAVEGLKNLQGYYILYKEQLTIEQKFIELGVFDVSELESIYGVLPLFNQEKWDLYQSFTLNQKNNLEQINSKIDFLKNDLKLNYKLKEDKLISAQLRHLADSLPQMILLGKQIIKLNQRILDVFSVCESFEDYKKSIIQSHSIKFESFYPMLSSFNMNTLKLKVEALMESENMENQLFADRLIQKIKHQFDINNRLIQTSNIKLSEEEKSLKQQLKRGKSILIKEFSKTRQHPSFRELINSDAFLWIKILKPFWLTNPTQLAKLFPLQQDLFDIGVMDEASQMPVYNALGALQRCKRVIIAGDEQQMNPTSYFQKGSKEIISVLHQANYSFRKLVLTHHYRSKHVPLIHFSNTNFYNNQLMVYPSFPVDFDCVKRHFCPTGKYIERKNLEEATQVVKLIEDKINSTKTIGIVAFSQNQVDAIWKLMPLELLEKVNQRIENRTLFIKPLEKVQGDECEHLIITLGYAVNEHGDFYMKFGPLNTASGRNRLNVLFSRASETIDFVCSIESSVLKWSENESIQLLYKWLRSLAQENSKESIVFPLNLNPSINKNYLVFHNVHQSLPNAIELKTTYSILAARGWKIDFN